jgi:PleD family two-component response regulator
MQDAADLIKVSDLALYKAKDEGRNRTIQGTADDLLNT